MTSSNSPHPKTASPWMTVVTGAVGVALAGAAFLHLSSKQRNNNKSRNNNNKQRPRRRRTTTTTTTTANQLFRPFMASAPGKVILCGEHSVVHGTRALATVIDKRSYIEVEAAVDEMVTIEVDLAEHSCRGQFPVLVVHQIIHDHLPQHDAVVSAFAATKPQPTGDVWKRVCDLTDHIPLRIILFYYVYLMHGTTLVQPDNTEYKGLSLYVYSDLPIGAGTGSSASFSVAASTAFMYLHTKFRRADVTPALVHRDACATKSLFQHAPQANKLTMCTCVRHEVNGWAYEGERVLHGTPSGVDNTVITFGGAVMFRRGEETVFLPALPHLSVLVTNTNVSRNTKTLVAGVAALHRAWPKVTQPMMDAIDALVGEFVAVLEQGHEGSVVETFEKCAALVRINQGLLDGLGVGHPAITRIKDIGEKLGFPTKLSGAGGGGCVISLVPPQGDETKQRNVAMFEEKCANEGFTALETSIGGEGCLVEQL